MAILRLFSRRSHPTIQTTALLSTIRDICSCGFTYSLPGPLCTISSNQVSFALRIASSQSAFSSPFCKWMDASCPLFLASPPWKLLQSATPLHLTSEYLLRSSSPLRLLSKDNQTIAIRYEENVQRTVKNERENVCESGINWTEGFFNFPNIISMSRLVSGPMLGWLIIEEYYVPAFIGLGISGATDWLDGYVARKMQVNSVVGSYLDPLADKVLIGCVVLAMLKNGLLHPGLVGLVIFRDLALIGGAFYKRAHDLGSAWKNWSDFINIDATHPKKVEPLFLSKVNTVFQLLLVAAALLQPELGIQETQTYITYLSWLVASTTIASSVAYGAQYLNLLGPANNFR